MLNLTPKKTILKNGIRLITAPNKATNTVSVLMFFKTGSRFENPKIQGISHFLEHMIFKGTKKRPNPIDISKAMDRIGAEFNAFTSNDQTGYYIKAEASHVGLIFDLLGDILLNSEFKSAEIEREKGPVISEIRRHFENPESYIHDVSYETLFGNTNIGRNVAGSEKTVTGLTRKTLVDYYKTHYFAHNLIVGVSGNISETEVKTLAEKHLGALKGGEYHSPEQVQPKFKDYKVELKTRPLKQTQVSVAFPAHHHNHPDLAAQKLLQVILGGGMSSRLFVEVREKRGLCYYVYASSDQFEETGGFFITSGVDAKRVDLALTTILQELKKIKKHGVQEKELKDAFDQIKGRLMISLEDSFAVAEYMVTQEAFKVEGAQDLKTILKHYEKVTTKDIQRVARDLFKKESMALTLVGPFKDKKHFQKIVDRSF